MKKKQTAVQWLEYMYINGENYSVEAVMEWFKTAKQMEKEQMEKAVSTGISKADMTNNRGYFDFEQYYNETYE